MKNNSIEKVQLASLRQMGMIKKTVYIIALTLIGYSFLACSRDMYVAYTPRNAIHSIYNYEWADIPRIEPNDTITIKENSLTENFIVTEIKKEKGVYAITVESDSIRQIDSCSYHSAFSYHPSYIIYSIKTEKDRGYKKIKKGQRYNLTLQPCFKNCPLFSHQIIDIYIKGMYVPIIKSTLDVFISPDLDGLYYIRLANNTAKK
jgi:DNA-binding XRE family transcriptional regulator